MRVPIRRSSRPAISSTSPVTVALSATLPARVKGRFASAVTIDQAVPARLGPLHVEAKGISIGVGAPGQKTPP